MTSPSTPLVRQRVVVSGLGAVGTSLLQLLLDRADDLRERHSLVVDVVGAVDSRGAAASAGGLDLAAVLATKRGGASAADLPGAGRPGARVADVLAEVGDGVDVLVEAGPGDLGDGGAGLAAVREAQRRGLDVVLANKAPLVLAWGEVTGGAGGSRVRYGACAGGAVPTVDAGRRLLASASALRVETALNSTCNLVLRLVEGGATAEEAIAEAQRRGVAEPDPSTDVDGWDAAVKLVIIANAVLGRAAVLDDVAVTGIRDVDPAELAAARERGEAVVLVGLAEREGPEEEWRLSVRPTALARTHPLARMEPEEQGVVFTTDVAGRLAVTGYAPDAVPTAASVLRDLVDLAATAR